MNRFLYRSFVSTSFNLISWFSCSKSRWILFVRLLSSSKHVWKSALASSGFHAPTWAFALRYNALTFSKNIWRWEWQSNIVPRVNREKKQWTGIYLARVLVLQYNVQLQNSNLCLLICIVHNLARVEFLFWLIPAIRCRAAFL